MSEIRSSRSIRGQLSPHQKGVREVATSSPSRSTDDHEPSSCWELIARFCKDAMLSGQYRKRQHEALRSFQVVDPRTLRLREAKEIEQELREEARERKWRHREDEWWLNHYPNHKWRTLPRPDYPKKMYFTIEFTETQLEGLCEMVRGFEGRVGTPEAVLATMVLRQIRNQQPAAFSGN
ncbi:MAG: hypothetical protein Q8R28_03000 [Dehalococcoidia bacterium]|nr:hypothetical protein [Dehalococcoidia bacterium]